MLVLLNYHLTLKSGIILIYFFSVLVSTPITKFFEYMQQHEGAPVQSFFPRCPEQQRVMAGFYIRWEVEI